jgi:hypothetical protein
LLNLIEEEGAAIADDAERLAGRLMLLSSEPEAIGAAESLRETAAKIRQQSKLEPVRKLLQ